MAQRKSALVNDTLSLHFSTCGPLGAINMSLRAIPHGVGQPSPAGFKQALRHQQLYRIHCSSYQCVTSVLVIIVRALII